MCFDRVSHGGNASPHGLTCFFLSVAVQYLSADPSDAGSGACAGRAPLAVEPAVADVRALTADLDGEGTALDHIKSISQQALNFLTTSSHPSPPPPQLVQLAESPASLPPPLDASFLATIASTLASSRRQSTSQPPTLTFRWTLSTIMHHYFPHQFGQVTSNGVTTYARDPRSDVALQAYHNPPHGRFSSNEDEDEPTTPLDLEADRVEGIRAATLSIAKRDEKMRWLLGGQSALSCATPRGPGYRGILPTSAPAPNFTSSD